ncbi:amidase [Paenibacillus sp. NFR01]|uniref:amidase n=1 Tax=Paenibacillus sp. NFR01 TaxID=1566279 RepID=UPI0008B876CD|nr:amidase [Paenibacillus sp. NFR01]SES95402.1 Asp-tRNAAsn/Glu-tRNAGln amidotransferase A subunit [Paenibacillus sp. NFR01]
MPEADHKPGSEAASGAIEIAKERMQERLGWTAVDVFLEKYAALEPHVQAFVYEKELPERIALEMQRLETKGIPPESRSPLYGVPVGIKDLLHVNGMPTHAGSALPPEALTAAEGSLVAHIRNQGGIVAGKTATEEFAYRGPFATRNPHHPAHTPGGSSAGSAAAVAAGMCPLAVGTQTLRSVTAPASFCGVAGYKPSYGRVPLDGVLLLSPTMDTVGFFTPELDSMNVFAAELVPDWTAGEMARPPVLGIPRGIYMEFMSPEVKSDYEAQVSKLERSGLTVKRLDMPWKDDFIAGDAMLRLVEGEMARIHERWSDIYADSYGIPVKEAISRGRLVPDAELADYAAEQLRLRKDLDWLMVQEGIDLWVSPAQGGTAPLLEEGRTGWPGMTAVWTFAGNPTITLPVSAIQGLPIGFQCIGRFGQDEQMLAFTAKVLELLENKSCQ